MCLITKAFQPGQEAQEALLLGKGLTLDALTQTLTFLFKALPPAPAPPAAAGLAPRARACARTAAAGK